MKHTPEPWAATNGAIWVPEYYPDGEPTQYKLADSNAEDAARIVACVNACAGMEDPEMEIQKMKRLNSQHWIMRDALEMIAGERQCVNNMLSDKEIAIRTIEMIWKLA